MGRDGIVLLRNGGLIVLPPAELDSLPLHCMGIETSEIVIVCIDLID